MSATRAWDFVRVTPRTSTREHSEHLVQFESIQELSGAARFLLGLKSNLQINRLLAAIAFANNTAMNE
jgi:hypothetical protein